MKKIEAIVREDTFHLIKDCPGRKRIYQYDGQ